MKHSQQTKDRCYQLRAAGAHFKDIARICNVTEKTASAWCKENPDEIIKWLNDDEREFIYFHRHLLATKVERIDDLARKLMDRLHRDEVGMGMMPYEKAAKLFINLTNTSTKLMHIGIPKEATFPVRMRQTHITYQQLTRTQLAQQAATRKQKKNSSKTKAHPHAHTSSPIGTVGEETGEGQNKRPHLSAEALAKVEAANFPIPHSALRVPHCSPLTGNSHSSTTPKPTKNPNKPAVSEIQPRQTQPQKPVIPTAPIGAPICNRRSASKHEGTSKTYDIIPSCEASWTTIATDSFSSVPEARPSTGNCQTSNTPKLPKNPNKPADSAVQSRETKPQKPVNHPTLTRPPQREASLDSAGRWRPSAAPTPEETTTPSHHRESTNPPIPHSALRVPHSPLPLTEDEIAYIENSPDDPTPEEQIKIMSIFEKLTAYYQYLADQEDTSN